jgi:hypothetical protein
MAPGTAVDLSKVPPDTPKPSWPEDGELIARELIALEFIIRACIRVACDLHTALIPPLIAFPCAIIVLSWSDIIL